ncbi:MAG: peptidoglycan bridge formation glycyltransferase FemA/FemB family protein, partial [Candidatus Dojkabacteria bacterium]|nr:peptidoglycan bridge formation glycyltransferase FemA/FemB family protein [Candidatus Dojkabacteria bacterium]
GKKIERLAIFFNGKIVGLSLSILQSSRFEKYVYCPRGPLLIKKDDIQCYTQVLGALKEYWSKKNVGAIKIDPGFIENTDIAKVPKQLGFVHSVNFVQSENNWMIDLVGNDEKDLFKWCKEHGMNKNYPTYIRKARRDGVEITFSKDKKDWDLFQTYLKISGRRKDFEVKNKEYYLNLWKFLGEKSNILRLGIAKLDGDILAMILIAMYGDEISVLYSTQTDMENKVRSTMLLRWESMLLGQRKGIKRFNNWGVLPEKKYKEKNPGYGYSHYKRDFGGYLENIERTYEYAYKPIPHLLQRFYNWYIKIRYYRFR